jgi:hypothetical protein
MGKENLRGGVFVIGSLLWEKSEIRKSWRLGNLEWKKRKLVNLPLRYGRISTSRSCTFTMVFSSDCKPSEKIGKGYFIPFKNNPLPRDTIFSQARKLMDAEHNKFKNLNRFNWGWGTLGLAINPKNYKNANIKKEVEAFSKEWANKYSSGFNPKEYKVGDELPIISNKGILRINWPERLKEFDFAIGTVCKPEIEEYPTAKEIAERILVNKYDEYFKENLKHSISTFQDKEIKSALSIN